MPLTLVARHVTGQVGELFLEELVHLDGATNREVGEIVVGQNAFAILSLLASVSFILFLENYADLLVEIGRNRQDPADAAKGPKVQPDSFVVCLVELFVPAPVTPPKPNWRVAQYASPHVRSMSTCRAGGPFVDELSIVFDTLDLINRYFLGLQNHAQCQREEHSRDL